MCLWLKTAALRRIAAWDIARQRWHLCAATTLGRCGRQAVGMRCVAHRAHMCLLPILVQLIVVGCALSAIRKAKRFDRIGVYEKEDIPDGMSEADLKRTSTERRVAAQHQVAELTGDALASKMSAPHRLLLTLVAVPVLGLAVRPLLQRHAAKQQSAAPARPAVDEHVPTDKEEAEHARRALKAEARARAANEVSKGKKKSRAAEDAGEAGEPEVRKGQEGRGRGGREPDGQKSDGLKRTKDTASKRGSAAASHGSSDVDKKVTRIVRDRAELKRPQDRADKLPANPAAKLHK